MASGFRLEPVLHIDCEQNILRGIGSRYTAPLISTPFNLPFFSRNRIGRLLYPLALTESGGEWEDETMQI